jgi:hypothetical protein
MFRMNEWASLTHRLALVYAPASLATTLSQSLTNHPSRPLKTSSPRLTSLPRVHVHVRPRTNEPLLIPIPASPSISFTPAPTRLARSITIPNSHSHKYSIRHIDLEKDAPSLGCSSSSSSSIPISQSGHTHTHPSPTDTDRLGAKASKLGAKTWKRRPSSVNIKININIRFSLSKPQLCTHSYLRAR